MANEDAVSRRAARDPNLGKILGKTATSAVKGVTGTIGAIGSTFEKTTAKLTSVNQIAPSKAYENLLSLDTFTSSVTGSLDNISLQLQKNLEPFSEYVGSTLGTLTGVIEDPLGPNGLGNVATRLINKVSPGAGDKINNLNKSLNLQAISKFPGQMMAGIDHILTGVRNLLSIPLSILSEIYYGYQAIMQSISKMINGVLDSFSKLFFDFLDSIIPIKSILSLLDSISTLASQIGDIAGAFNVTAITDVTNMITGFTDQFTSILEDPLEFATSFLPANVSSFLSDIRDPQALLENLLPEQISGFVSGIQNPNNLIKQFLPPEMANGFDKLADMTGFGFHNNLGFGFKSVLEGTQKSVLQDVVASFGDKMGALGPILAGQPDDLPETHQPKLDAGYNAAQFDETRRALCGAAKYTRAKLKK